MNEVEIEEYFEVVDWFDKLKDDGKDIEEIVTQMFQISPITSSRLLHQGFFMAICLRN